MIPNFDDGQLPPGLHEATWTEVVARFGFTPYRRGLLAGLRAAALDLKAAGCRTLYIDGSFASEKHIPADFDACWDPHGVVIAQIDPVLKTFTHERIAQKAKYGGELFPSTALANAVGATFLDFFQTDRDGNPKGLIVVDLRSLEP